MTEGSFDEIWEQLVVNNRSRLFLDQVYMLSQLPDSIVELRWAASDIIVNSEFWLKMLSYI